MSHLCSVNVLCDGSAVGGAVIILVGAVECVMLCERESGYDLRNDAETIEAMTKFLRNRQFQIRDALVETYVIREWNLVVSS
jgi:hypothetical protein